MDEFGWAMEMIKLEFAFIVMLIAAEYINNFFQFCISDTLK